MISSLPMVPLREILTKSEEWIDLKPDERYREVTVRLWGKGVVQRREVTGAEITARRRLVVRNGQFILSRIDARNGAMGLVPPSIDGAVVSNDFPVFTPNPDRILPSYLDWLSKTRGFVDLCRKASEGTTNRVRLAGDRLLDMAIPLPSVQDQERIVARIDQLSRRVAEVKQLRRQTEEGLQAVLLGAHARIIRDAPRLPMAEVAPLIRRPVKVEPSKDYHELGIRSFGRGTFHKPPIVGAELGSKKLFRIEGNDLLFNIVFAWEGAVAVARPEDDGRVGSHRFLTCVPRRGRSTASFLAFHFLTDLGLQQLGEASPGGAGRNRTLNLKALEHILVPVPAIELERWFETLLARATAMRRLQAEVDLELVALFRSTLASAF